MRRIIYTRADGGACIVSPVRNTFGEALYSNDEIEQRAWDKLPTDAINPQFVDSGVIPADRVFRNAWVQSGPSIVIDMPKARELHRDRLRELRAPRLAALDTAYLRADEAKDETEKARIAAQKQALRDVTADPRIEAAQTTEELKKAIPVELA